ncbi:hypothetical protein KI387_001510, partial [Taxus chinensis]
MNSKHWIEVTVILLSLVLFKPDSGSGSHEADPAVDQGSRQLAYVTVVGKVFCDTCFQRKFTRKSYFVP